MKKVVFFVSILTFVLIINNLLRSIYGLWQKQDLLVQTQKELSTKKVEQAHLKQELTQVKNPAFIEEQARNKLFLAKPGEEFVLLPTPTGMPQTQAQKKQPKTHWQEWLALFFGANK